jgi:hypothetical protein
MYSTHISIREEGQEVWVMIARERADCNETEKMDKKNWSKLDQGIWRKKEACFAKSSRNNLEVGWMNPLDSIIKGTKETPLVLQAHWYLLTLSL